MRQPIITCLIAIVALAACEKEAPPPDWEVRYKKVRGDADAAFAANQASRAAELFRVARDLLPANDSRKPECAQLLATCQFLDAKDRATQLLAQGKREEAVMAMETARKALAPGDSRIPEADRLIQGFKYQIKLKAGQEKMAKKDWLAAVKDFEEAGALATEAQASEASGLKEFCGQFAEADEAFLVKQDFPKARPIYEGLLKNPRGFEKEISERLQAVGDAAQKAEAKKNSEMQAKLNLAVAKGVEHLARAEWAQARDVLEAATTYGIASPELEAHLKVARSAASPPPGFVYVPAGKFLFGAGPASTATGPEQEISTEAFYLAKGEVTNAEYRKFLEAYKDHSRCHHDEPAEKKASGHVPEGWSDSLDPHAPVTGVDWFDAWAYADWAGGRLPGEVEWEKAAGWNPVTGKKSAYPWGDEFSKEKGGPSPCGAEAMAGGVLEWMSDWYLTYPGGNAGDIDFGQKRRVARGGIFIKEDEKEDARVTRRFRFLPDRRDPHIGFRVLRPIESDVHKS